MDIDREALKRMIDERGIESLEDLNGLLKEISKEVITSLYEGEIRDHLGYDEHTQHASQIVGNSRNGYGTKTVHTVHGDIIVHPPRDRNGSFSPQIIKKRQRDISGIEDKVVGLYAKGMSTMMSPNVNTASADLISGFAAPEVHAASSSR